MLENASFRRAAAVIAAMVVAIGNKKLGLDLDPKDVTELLVLLGMYVLASNYKEVAVEKAKATAAAAAAKATPDEAKAAVDRVAGPPGSGSSALVLALCASLLAFPGVARAQVADAPIVTQSVTDLRCLDSAQEQRLGKHIISLETENAELRKSVGVPPLLTAALVVAGVLLGAGVGVGVTLAVTKQPVP